MILVIDTGNTNIKFGVYDGDNIKYTGRLATDRLRTADQYSGELYQIFKVRKIDYRSFTGAIIGSVVPEINRALKTAVKAVTGVEPMVLGPGIKTGLNILIDDPAQLGADLVAGAVAVVNKYPLPCLLTDMGTATKISVIDENGAYRGGMISPGVGISLNALSSGASLLASVPLEAPKNPIGTNTVACMQSGLVFGNACMIDGMIDLISSEIKAGVKSLVATGGISPAIIPHCSHKIEYDPNVVLDGLKIIYDKNK